jgi:hypothetical protein
VDALFDQIAREEANIRANAGEDRDIPQEVFGVGQSPAK